MAEVIAEGSLYFCTRVGTFQGLWLHAVVAILPHLRNKAAEIIGFIAMYAPTQGLLFTFF